MSSHVAQGSQGWSPLFLFSISLPLISFNFFFFLLLLFYILGLRAEDLVIGSEETECVETYLKYVQYFSMLVFSLRNKGHIIVMIFIRTHWFLTRHAHGLMQS